MALELRTVEQPNGSWRLVGRYTDTGTGSVIDDFGTGSFAYSEAKAARLVALSAAFSETGGISYDSGCHDMFE